MYSEREIRIMCELDDLRQHDEKKLDMIHSFKDITDEYDGEKKCMCEKTFDYFSDEFCNEYLYCFDCKIMVRLIPEQETVEGDPNDKIDYGLMSQLPF